MNKKIFALYGVGIICLVLLSYMWWAFNNEEEQNKIRESTRIVEDMTGSKVAIPAHPKRVVFLNTSNMDMYYAVGGEAVGRVSASSLEGKLLEATKDVPIVGNTYSPNVEKVLSLHPDLVIGAGMSNQIAMRDVLAKAGVPLYINDLNTYDDVLRSLQLFGELTGHEELGKEVISRIEGHEKELMNKAKGEVGKRSLIIFGSPGTFSMATSQSYSGDILRRLGGHNIADGIGGDSSGYVAMSMESVAKANPEVIFFIVMLPDPKIVDSFKKEMAESPIWKDIDAVKTGRVYYLPGGLFALNPGTRIIESMDLMYSYLYGDKK